MPHTSFDPAVQSFHFDNRFVNVVARLPGGTSLRTSGRCGGMTYAALDYFYRHEATPGYVPVPPARVPPDGHPLADYLLRRQLESFASDSAVRFLSWSIFPDESLPFAKGVRRWTSAEMSLLRRRIDRGDPVAIGLIGARRLGDAGRFNHQAVAFGYELVRGGIDVHIYDPNTRGRTTVLRWRSGRPEIEASNRSGRPWRGLFVHHYVPVTPPSSAD